MRINTRQTIDEPMLMCPNCEVILDVEYNPVPRVDDIDDVYYICSNCGWCNC